MLGGGRRPGDDEAAREAERAWADAECATAKADELQARLDAQAELEAEEAIAERRSREAQREFFAA